MNEFDSIASGFTLLIFVFVLLRLISLEKLVARLSRIDAKLDLLLKQSGLEFDPYQDLPPQVMEAIQRGQKIEAIKHYREATGSDLKEAKEFIEEIERRAGRST